MNFAIGLGAVQAGVFLGAAVSTLGSSALGLGIRTWAPTVATLSVICKRLRNSGISQGTSSVAMAYDNDDRRTSLTLPNGVVVEYVYDDDSRLTGMTYKLGVSTLGTLTYTYDANGRRTTVAGTWARTNLPAALTSATYDDANQIATFGGTTFTYDDNGNLTSDGVRAYAWNARNQLASLTGRRTAASPTMP